MTKFTAVRAACLLAGATLAGPANGAVNYSFQSYSSYALGTTLVNFTYTAPDFVTTDGYVSPTDCQVTAPTSVSCARVQLLAPVFQSDADTVGLVLSNNSTYFFYFAEGAFGRVGTYETVSFGASQAATLTVSLAGGVPEPSVWAVLTLGFGVIGAAIRGGGGQRRFAMAD